VRASSLYLRSELLVVFTTNQKSVSDKGAKGKTGEEELGW